MRSDPRRLRLLPQLRNPLPTDAGAFSSVRTDLPRVPSSVPQAPLAACRGHQGFPSGRDGSDRVQLMEGNFVWSAAAGQNRGGDILPHPPTGLPFLGPGLPCGIWLRGT